MILHVDSDASYLSEPLARSRTGGHYYLISLPADPVKAPNLPLRANGPIHMECGILKHLVVSEAKAEVGGLFQNGKIAVPLRITHHELGFPLPLAPIKTDNSASEGIATATVRQESSKAMDMQFYWMKDRFKKKSFLLETRKSKHGFTHHITIGKSVLHICIWQMT